MVPVHDTGNDYAIDLRKHFIERCAIFRRITVQLGNDLPGLHIRRDRALGDLFSIIRDPIGDFPRLPAEFFRWSVA